MVGYEASESVRHDHHVRERIEVEGVIVGPVDWAHLRGERTEVTLGGERLGELLGDVVRLGEVNGVPAHLGEDVLTKDDQLFGAVLDPARVGCEHGAGHPLAEFLSEVFRQRWPIEEENRLGTLNFDLDKEDVLLW